MQRHRSVLAAAFVGALSGALALALGTQACGTSGSGAAGSSNGATNGASNGSNGAASNGAFSAPNGTSNGGASRATSNGAASGEASNGAGSNGASSNGASGNAGSDAGSTFDAAPGPGSAGCGAASLPTPDSIPDGGGFFGSTLPIERFTISVGGVTREFILGLPASYDANRKYPAVFAWHGQGGTDVQIAWGGTSSLDDFGGYYGLRYLSTQNSVPMIFVAGQGLDENDAGAGWPNTNGEDIAFTQAMVTWLETNLCVDEGHVFSVGMSYGGIMSNTVGCKMGNVFRAIAPMSGIGPGFGFGSPGCVGQVAAWVAHGSQDTTIPVEAGMASRDYWVQANHCTSTTMPLDPSPCVAYQGCDPGYPVDWCEFDGGHTVVSFEPPGIWAFLQQF